MSHTTSLERRRRHPPWRFGSAGLGPSGGEPSPPHRSGKNTGKKPLAGGLAERVYRAVSPNVAGTPSACAVSERITGREQPVARARVFAKHPGQRPRTCRSRAPRLHSRAAVTRAAVREAIRDERRVDNERKRLFTTRSMARGRWLEAVRRLERDVEHPRSSSRGGRSTRQVIHGPATDIPPPTTSGHFCHRRTICPGIEQKARRSGDGFWPPQAR